jgi:hypothetical protein
MKQIVSILFILIFLTCKTTDPNQLVNTSFKAINSFDCQLEIHECLLEMRSRMEFLYFYTDFKDSETIEMVSSVCHELIFYRSWIGQNGSVKECRFPLHWVEVYRDQGIADDEILILTEIHPEMKMSIVSEFYNNAVVGLLSVFLPIPHYNYRPYSYKISKIKINILAEHLYGKG